MAKTALIVDRPKRWDSAFDPNMTDADVARLLTTAPFSQMKADRFPLRDILRNDAGLRRFRAGEIIVREGDYGTSAFLIIQGAVCVVKPPGLPESLLGRRPRRRKNLFAVLAQLWNNARYPEVRRASELRVDERLGQRDAGDDEVRVFLQDVPRVLDGSQTKSLVAGELFGEIAALSRAPRTATVFAEVDDTELLEIRWQGLRDIMKKDDALRQYVDKVYRERSLETYLRALPMLRHLTDEKLQELMRQTEFVTYGEYDWSGDYKRLLHSGGTGSPGKEPVIAQEADYPNGVVFIRSGFARLGRRFGQGQRTLSYLGAGQYYGFEEIAHNWRQKDTPVPLQLTLQAIGYTHVLIIPTAAMEELVLPTLPTSLLPPLVETEAAVAPETPKLDQRDVSAKLGPDLLEFLTENRFFNGTATMLINLDQCTRCDDCVRACAATHDNNPRFLRHGPSSGPVMVANACMHCADPVCMIGCPTGAIHRLAFGGQVVINQATCIGCAICSNNCPYDAIRMVDIRGTDGAFLVDKDMRAIQKATKCDLCVDQYGGPACQRACPHGALLRADMSDVNTLAAWLGR